MMSIQPARHHALQPPNTAATVQKRRCGFHGPFSDKFKAVVWVTTCSVITKVEFANAQPTTPREEWPGDISTPSPEVLLASHSDNVYSSLLSEGNFGFSADIESRGDIGLVDLNSPSTSSILTATPSTPSTSAIAPCTSTFVDASPRSSLTLCSFSFDSLSELPTVRMVTGGVPLSVAVATLVLLSCLSLLLNGFLCYIVCHLRRDRRERRSERCSAEPSLDRPPSYSNSLHQSGSRSPSSLPSQAPLPFLARECGDEVDAPHD